MEILLAVLVIVLGSYVQSTAGFGLAIIAAPVLFFLDPAYVPVPITLCALALSLANAHFHRASISFRGLQCALAGRVPGSLAGAFLLVWIEPRWLALWLGLSVLVAVVISVRAIPIKPTSGAMFTAGFLSGFMGTSTSIGGPPMALIMQHQRAHFIRANLAAFFVVSCLISLVVLVPTDHFSRQQILLSLPLLPATLIGYWLARRTWHRVSANRLRLATLVLCTVSGLAAVASFWLDWRP
ncbi:MAG: sulfite exporter TauE/SafE family protein [Pseudohongiellaceae bacterium]